MGRTGRRAAQRRGHAAQIDDDGLDAVSLALDLGEEPLHLVPVEGILDIAADIDGSHDGGDEGRQKICLQYIIEELGRSGR